MPASIVVHGILIFFKKIYNTDQYHGAQYHNLKKKSRYRLISSYMLPYFLKRITVPIDIVIHGIIIFFLKTNYGMDGMVVYRIVTITENSSLKVYCYFILC